MRSCRSFWRGVWHYQWLFYQERDFWVVKRNVGWWAHWWTPSWHKGRGPYVSIGLGPIAIYRGY